jgi:hypothetical protein
MQFACEPAKQFVSQFNGLCRRVRWLTSGIWLQSIITTSFIEASTTLLPSGGPFSMCFKVFVWVEQGFSKRSPHSGCLGSTVGGSARARGVLQHDLEWAKEESFGAMLPPQLKRPWSNLREMGQGTGEFSQDDV